MMEDYLSEADKFEAVGSEVPHEVVPQVAPGYIDRLHGPILTYASIDDLGECMRRGRYNAKKVITEGGPPGGWTPEARRRVVKDLTPWVNDPGKTIVRTVAGDGQRDDLGQGYADNPDEAKLYPLPDRVANEITPWYQLDRELFFEIGNEPNNFMRADGSHGWWYYFKKGDAEQQRRATKFVYNYRYWFDQSLQRVRSQFPGAKVISPGLAANNPVDVGGRPEDRWGYDVWYEVCKDVFSKCDVIGGHVFGAWDFHGSQSWNAKLIASLTTWYRDNYWMVTEYGLHGLSNEVGFLQRKKGRLYCEAAHFGRSEPAWPTRMIGGLPQMRGALQFHLDTRPRNLPPERGGMVEPQYVIYDFNGDYAYRFRKDFDSIALKSAANGMYVCADGDRGWALIANRNAIQGSWEIFARVSQGRKPPGSDYIWAEAGRAGNGKYVCADGDRGWALIANRNAIQGSWEIFEGTVLGNNRLALKAVGNGKWVRAEPNQGWALIASGDSIGTAETFEITNR